MNNQPKTHVRVLASPWHQKGLHRPLAAEKEAIPSASSFGLLDGVQRCHQLGVWSPSGGQTHLFEGWSWASCRPPFTNTKVGIP